MAGKQTMDLTRGSPLRQIFLFALPLVVGTLLQQLYSFVDTAMVGRILGEAALAAVGTTHSLNFLTLGFAQGTCLGFGIPMAKAVGAKDTAEQKRLLWNGIWLCLMFSFVMTALTLLLVGPMLRMIRTPESIYADARRYITMIFCGMPTVVFYNFSAAVLRATGDSKRPTLFLLCTCLLNVLLDYVLLAVIPMGVAGAALATVLSQLVSCLLNLGWLGMKTELFREAASHRQISAVRLALLCRAGFPMGLDYTISALGALAVQRAINALGTAAIAAQTTGEKIRQMFTLPLASVGSAMATYMGQNAGAQRYDRVRAGIRAGLVILLAYSAAGGLVLLAGKGFLVSLVLGADAGEAGALAVRYLVAMGCALCLAGASSIFRNTLQGLGYNLHAMFSGVCQMIGSVAGGWLAANHLGFTGVCLANPLAWGFAAAYCGIMIAFHLKLQAKKEL